MTAADNKVYCKDKERGNKPDGGVHVLKREKIDDLSSAFSKCKLVKLKRLVLWNDCSYNRCYSKKAENEDGKSHRGKKIKKGSDEFIHKKLGVKNNEKITGY